MKVNRTFREKECIIFHVLQKHVQKYILYFRCYMNWKCVDFRSEVEFTRLEIREGKPSIFSWILSVHGLRPIITLKIILSSM